jgi:hypothetical protein
MFFSVTPATEPGSTFYKEQGGCRIKSGMTNE